jgi:hypothetical protein
MPKAYFIEVRNRTAGIVARDAERAARAIVSERDRIAGDPSFAAVL